MNFFKRRGSSASKAKERLRVVIDSQRMSRNGHDELLKDLHKAILTVIQKHYDDDNGDIDVQIKADQADGSSEMELNIDIHGLKSSS